MEQRREGDLPSFVMLTEKLGFFGVLMRWKRLYGS